MLCMQNGYGNYEFFFYKTLSTADEFSNFYANCRLNVSDIWKSYPLHLNESGLNKILTRPRLIKMSCTNINLSGLIDL